jgi:putative oxidoreductase
MKTPFLIGRLIFGGFFLYNGINHFIQRESLAKYAAAKNVAAPELAVTVSGAALTLGGASIILGIKPKIGTAAVAGFLAAVSPVMHDFWRTQDEGQKMSDMVNFSKNMALLGAVMAIMAIDEPWSASVPVSRPGKIERMRRSIRRQIAA